MDRLILFESSSYNWTPAKAGVTRSFDVHTGKETLDSRFRGSDRQEENSNKLQSKSSRLRGKTAIDIWQHSSA
ncbi:MAG: hypothetical protein OXJ52_03880 [Oligoflexia bacterium]|nr:hypothetical protein [Oligoflexia bacterium]